MTIHVIKYVIVNEGMYILLDIHEYYDVFLDLRHVSNACNIFSSHSDKHEQIMFLARFMPPVWYPFVARNAAKSRVHNNIKNHKRVTLITITPRQWIVHHRPNTVIHIHIHKLSVRSSARFESSQSWLSWCTPFWSYCRNKLVVPLTTVFFVSVKLT